MRLPVLKTYKLYINGAFPRTESGRSLRVESPDGTVLGHVCHASRKDLRDAVGAAHGASKGWAKRTAYNRAQILYRLSEMLEGKADEFTKAIRDSTGRPARSVRREVDAAIDRLVGYAGWADKYAQILGCNNPVAGPFYNFTVPEPTGTVAVVCPDDPPLLGMISLLAPVICGGSAAIVVAPDSCPIAASILGEVCATSDVPAGVINILTGQREELLAWIAEHREINAVHAAGLDADETRTLRLGAAENVKRVHVRDIDEGDWYDPDVCESPWWIEPFVEMKTIWHPAST